MMDIAKLRKVNDDLYLEDEDTRGAKNQFKYERGIETLRFDLFDARVEYSSEIDLRETQFDSRLLFMVEGDDTRTDTRADKIESNVVIRARSGEFENGDCVIIFDHDKQLSINRASFVTIKPVLQWDEFLQRVRSKGKQLWAGHAIVFSSKEAQEGHGSADRLNLELYMPAEQFDYIANAIARVSSDRVKLSAVVMLSAFRTAADRALSEPWHQMQIGIEKHTPAILHRLTATNIIGPSENHLPELFQKEPLKPGNAKSASDIWLPRLFWLGLAILAAVLMRL